MPEGNPKKRRRRRNFTDEFKAEAVRLVLDEAKTVGQVARDLDLTESALRMWVERARADLGNGKPGVLTSAEREELAKLGKNVRAFFPIEGRRRRPCAGGVVPLPDCLTVYSGLHVQYECRLWHLEGNISGRFSLF